MTAEVASDARCGIGARLRAGRERMGVSLLQACEKLHVDAKVLESLESEQFDALGAAVFARGHIRRYASFVGERPAELLDLYGQSPRTGVPDLTRAPMGEHSADSQKLVVPMLVVLLGFALAGAVWWVLTLSKSGKTARAAAPAAAVAAAEPAVIVPPPAAPGGALVTAPAVTAKPAPHLATVAAAPVAYGHAASHEADAARPPSVARSASTQLSLHFAADSWTEVYDATGARLFYDVGSAASVHTVSGTAPLRVVLANAAGVSIDVNGHHEPVPAAARKGDGAAFTVNRSGSVVRTPAKARGE